MHGYDHVWSPKNSLEVWEHSQTEKHVSIGFCCIICIQVCIRSPRIESRIVAIYFVQITIRPLLNVYPCFRNTFRSYLAQKFLDDVIKQNVNAFLKEANRKYGKEAVVSVDVKNRYLAKIVWRVSLECLYCISNNCTGKNITFNRRRGGLSAPINFIKCTY